MIALLALVGLGVVLLLLARGLTKLGSILERLGDQVSIQEATFRVHKRSKPKEQDPYIDNVRREIDEITKGEAP